MKRFLHVVLLWVMCCGSAFAAETISLNSLNSNSSGSGWSFSSGLLTISAAGAYTITGSGSSATGNRIKVNPNLTVNVTLSNVKISTDEAACAFEIGSSSTVILTLAAGTTNELRSDGIRAGLEVPSGATLVVQGSGTLTATSGATGAGIGGKGGSAATSSGGAGGDGESCGSITILSGKVDAESQSGAGIGGGAGGKGGKGGNGGKGGSGGSITIVDGTVRAVCYGQSTDYGSGSAGIGGGSGGAGGEAAAGGGNSGDITIHGG